jgi:molybdenum cofactor sulfurtransferase
LDHAGTTLYAKSFVERFSRDMVGNLFGNPHSASPSSDLSTRRVTDVRKRVLQFFRADPEHFDVIFVANASAGIKLVAEAFREFQDPGFWYGYHNDAHTSLVGIRELAATVRCFESDGEVDTWLQEIDKGEKNSSDAGVGLFAYPAQSNMNGHRLPMRWSGQVRQRSGKRDASPKTRIYTLLDAAAYVMTAQLDLSDEKAAPDFTALSFYKIFGFPNLGALIVRKEAGNILRQRRFFGGGTVDMVTVNQNPWHANKTHTLHDALEDGTLPFHQIVALGHALDVHAETFGTMSRVSEHTCKLAAYTYFRLQSLRHANGRQVCSIYKDDSSWYGDFQTQGPTIAFNVQNSQGAWIGKSEVERLAIVRGIHLRSGGVCNPGGIAKFCDLAHWELRRNFFDGMRCGDDFDIIRGKPTGIVRISFGAMSNQQDADNFILFVDELFVEKVINSKHNCVPPVPAECRVDKVVIFPVLGCAGWNVPSNISWPVGEHGLAWNMDWCVLPQGGNVALDPIQHPKLNLIKPELDISRGYLRLSGLSAQDTPLAVEISLWDDPGPENYSDSVHLLADRYQSEAIKTFFTNFLGIPSTLARFRDPRRLAKSGVCSHTILPTGKECFLTVSLSSAESSANLSLPSALGCTNHRFIKINQHFFEKIEVRTTQAKSDIWRFVYLHDISDQSATAQNPCVRVGDDFRSFSVLPMHDDPKSRLPIAAMDVGRHVCAVWNCRRVYVSDSDLATHLQCHKPRKSRRFRVRRLLDGCLGRMEKNELKQSLSMSSLGSLPEALPAKKRAVVTVKELADR